MQIKGVTMTLNMAVPMNIKDEFHRVWLVGICDACALSKGFINNEMMYVLRYDTV